MVRIALCVIAKDKETIIERMLDSTLGVFHGYFLQDTGSSDKTVEVFENWCEKHNKEYKTSKKYIGKDYKEVVVDGKSLLGDFGSARNDSFALAKGYDFAVWLDTDDVMVGAEKIVPIVERMDKEGIGLALLTYVYARGNDGLKPVVQKRERIIDLRIRGAWKDRVHETYETLQPTKIVEVNEIQVEHLRSAFEAIGTGRRNNIIMIEQLKEEGIENLSDKVLHNLAFDHWEHREFKESLKFYKELIKRLAAQNHREALYSAYIKIAYAYMCINKPYRSISYCLKAVGIAPNMAEPYITLAQDYAMLNMWEDAARCANKVLEYGIPNTTAPINEYDFLISPRKILEQYYLFKNMDKEAKSMSEEIVRLSPLPVHKLEKFKVNNEVLRKEAIRGIISLTKYITSNNDIEMFDRLKTAIPLDLKDDNNVRSVIKELTEDYNRKGLKTLLNGSKSIVIYAGGHYEAWDGNSDKEKGIGGSEGMCIQLSRELAKLGNKVIVFNECGESDGKTIDGVMYIDHKKFDSTVKVDVFISLRRPDVFNYHLKAKKQYLWLHDTEYGDKLDVGHFYAANKVIVLSGAHKTVIKENHGIVNDNIFWQTRNGLNMESLKWADKNVEKRDPYKFIYASSYDRGLDNVLGMWERIKEKVPQATLDIYYGWNTYDAMMNQRQGTPQGEYMKNYKNKIVTMLTELAPLGVTEKGRVSQKELYKAFGEAGVWIYPTQFYEISCINAMTAQAMGALPLCTPYAALNETVSSDYGIKTSVEEMIDACEYMFSNLEEFEIKRGEMIKWAREKYDMESLAKEWDNFFNID